MFEERQKAHLCVCVYTYQKILESQCPTEHWQYCLVYVLCEGECPSTFTVSSRVSSSSYECIYSVKSKVFVYLLYGKKADVCVCVCVYLPLGEYAF
jgi:hypothetical protein